MGHRMLMKSQTRYCFFACVAGIVLFAGGEVFGQVDLNGTWHSEEGIVTIVQDGNSVYVLAPSPDKCDRTYYLRGTLTGDKLSGTMWRCTNKDLVAECGHQKNYPTNFTATVSRYKAVLGLVGPEVGAIKIESQQFNPAFPMEYWNKSTCQEEAKKPLSNLVFRDSNRPINRSPATPSPTPTPPVPCSNHPGGTAAWEKCMRDGGLRDGVLQTTGLDKLKGVFQ